MMMKSCKLYNIPVVSVPFLILIELQVRPKAGYVLFDYDKGKKADEAM